VEVQNTELDVLVLIVAGGRTLNETAALLGSLPPDLTAPVVMSSNADREVLLSTFKNSAPSSPRFLFVDQRTAIERGKIYLLAGDESFSFADGALELKKSAQPGRIERGMASAAAAYGERLIAVLMSPEGPEIAAGAVEVKRRHGLVMYYQSRLERSDSTITALPPTAYEHFREVKPLSEVLARLSQTKNEAGQEELTRQILEHATRKASIDFRLYKPGTIMRRIDRRVAVTGCGELGAYLALLEKEPSEASALVSSFLIGVTEFFRDPEAYSFLKTTVLPAMIQSGRERGRVLRIWSVGCATGEEPYSIAILLCDLLGAELPEWTIKIFATDVGERAIDFARKGTYPANVLENVPWDYRTKYFAETSGGYRIAKHVRQMVIFGQQDLSRAAPFPRIDLVICRNVMIYFKPELQQDVLDLFAFSLQQLQGHLFLGKAETVRPSRARYELLNKKWKVYRCLQGPRVPHSRTSKQVERAGAKLETRRHDETSRTFDAEHPQNIDLSNVRRYNEQFLRNLPFGVVVIDRGYRIVSLNGAARRLLSILDAGPPQDFLHAARGIPYADMRAAIDTVFRERTQIQLDQVTLESTSSRDARFISVTLAPVVADHPSADLMMISIQDITERVEQRRMLEEAQAQQKGFLEQLETANRKFVELNKELQEANEGLQAANEEMMLAQEELQAANEELEATNEELQATNEELETNNEELQATNEELETTNDELHSRTQELQETARSFETERTRFAEMVTLAPFHILAMRGPGLFIEAFNPRFLSLFRERKALSSAIDDVFPEPELGELLNAAHESYRTDRMLELTTRLSVAGAPEINLHCSLVPTHDHAGKVDGVMLYADDVSKQKVIENEERFAKLNLMVENAGQTALALYDGATRKLLNASPRYTAIFDGGPSPATVLEEIFSARSPKRLPEVRAFSHDGNEERLFDFTITPIAYNDQKSGDAPRYVVVSAYDITELARRKE
jgi:two-component system CheB/CheR fusion protein